MRLASKTKFKIIFLIFFSVQAKAGCFTEHLNSAIASNSARLPLYLKLENDGNTAAKILAKLIQKEKLLKLFTAPLMDLQAIYFEMNGVPVMCAGFVAIENLNPVPAATRQENTLSLNEFANLDLDKLRYQIQTYSEFDSYNFALLTLNDSLSQLRQKNMNCMLRHMLQSIRRFVQLAEIHQRASSQKNLVSSALFSKQMIDLHLWGLNFANELDREAAPVQAKGIPVICSELPEIPAIDPDKSGMNHNDF